MKSVRLHKDEFDRSFSNVELPPMNTAIRKTNRIETDFSRMKYRKTTNDGESPCFAFVNLCSAILWCEEKRMTVTCTKTLSLAQVNASFRSTSIFRLVRRTVSNDSTEYWICNSEFTCCSRERRIVFATFLTTDDQVSPLLFQV